MSVIESGSDDGVPDVYYLTSRGGTGPDFSSLEPCNLQKFELGPSPSLGPSMKFELRALPSLEKTARAGPGPWALPSIEAIFKPKNDIGCD